MGGLKTETGTSATEDPIYTVSRTNPSVIEYARELGSTSYHLEIVDANVTPGIEVDIHFDVMKSMNLVRQLTQSVDQLKLKMDAGGWVRVDDLSDALKMSKPLYCVLGTTQLLALSSVCGGRLLSLASSRCMQSVLLLVTSMSGFALTDLAHQCPLTMFAAVHRLMCTFVVCSTRPSS